MFPKKQSKDHKAATYPEKVSILAAGMQITGDIVSEGDMRIDGLVRGNVFCKSKVVIIASGKVIGDVKAVNIDVHGTVEGNIAAKELLCLKANCKITGNLNTEKLMIEPNAIFNGQCVMKGAQKSASVVNEEGEVLLQEH